MWFPNRNGRFAGNVVAEQAGTDGHTKSPFWKIRIQGDDFVPEGGQPAPDAEVAPF
jgi:hypothetical protein